MDQPTCRQRICLNGRTGLRRTVPGEEDGGDEGDEAEEEEEEEEAAEECVW